ncbi:hypothetical protein CHLV4088_01645 [Campylobacter helveticus]|uniref:hypothetical protein n=1 Tax=Campylobacter helveticus TaxID=28898 RepID=UPI002149F49E|nr:hypothetical protein [Campylobacter helveticus]MCR2056124.1 hypothetical protein [Campylobacter helveticus]
MKKYLLIFAFFLFLIGFYAYFKFDFNGDKNFSNNTEPLICDLNIQDCTFEFKDKKIRVSLNPKPLQAMDVLDLKIENLDFYKNLSLKIYGLNMFMGEIKPKLIYENSYYKAKLVLSTCVLDTMRYRAQFFKDNKPLGFHFDFELKR